MAREITEEQLAVNKYLSRKHYDKIVSNDDFKELYSLPQLHVQCFPQKMS